MRASAWSVPISKRRPAGEILADWMGTVVWVPVRHLVGIFGESSTRHDAVQSGGSIGLHSFVVANRRPMLSVGRAVTLWARASAVPGLVAKKSGNGGSRSRHVLSAPVHRKRPPSRHDHHNGVDTWSVRKMGLGSPASPIRRRAHPGSLMPPRRGSDYPMRRIAAPPTWR